MTTAESAAPDPTAPTRLTLRGRIVSDGAVLEDGLVAVEDDRIEYAGPAADFDAAEFGGEPVPLPDGALLLPGLVDLHCHGAGGVDFPSADEEQARRAVEFLHRHGTTTLLASLVTASREDLLRGVGLFSQLDDEGLVAGIHAEGPFLSHARCGAQNPDFLLEPDVDFTMELIEASEGSLATMTYAPELPGASDVVDLLTAHGVTPSLGHTACDDATAEASLEQARDGLTAAGFDGAEGVPTVTHLFNAMPPLHHRAPGPVAACLRAAAAGAAVVELVADGVHLAPATVRTVFALVGSANVALVTDSMAAAGLSDGSYMLGPSPVTVAGGVATLDADGSIAGGTATLLEVVARTAAAGVPLPHAVLSATAVPAAVLGRSDEFGSLRRGLRADIVATDADLGLAAVVRAGTLLTSPR
ncbi:N-acetylglucosamine-6-phosphate deacetylase [Sinomonas atrocyanea]|uniref:N-acetylglucosamine-6-phosphate deacetylase n=1 Tax=Sinomonas atrocyanea TaxID=37927 RepID=UPI00277D50D6|nr:amidohydrolase family protein [Sinomonas atrocyanea]MDQ0258295.1 N-acetylglucosamine-6-phosphate deacetylase [Sinomonas atrocyanea]MDR6620562.1 N-acetylglucosamine-6-phosphate deacetylase [Sinomonas atrocyanea]